jgi:hypothetical protein
MPEDIPPLHARRDKIALISGYFRMDGTGLELGPHVAPMFRRSEGIDVRYLDVRSGDRLRAMMQEAGRDPDIVEEIDYVLERGKTIAEHAPGQRFDWVTSAHVVEHIPDVLGHLHEVAEVLVEDGVYGLIVPDRNYCLDCLKAPTLLGQVIEAHMSKGRPGALGHMIDHWRYNARPRGIQVGGWAEDRAHHPLVAKFPNWKTRVKRLIDSGGAEVENWFGHQWFFDPRNFGEIVCDLIDLELIPYDLVALVPTYKMDFIAILRKTAAPDLAASRAVADEAAAAYRAPTYSRTLHEA